MSSMWQPRHQILLSLFISNKYSAQTHSQHHHLPHSPHRP
uniref:Uncharacterized protein n=1 Tax=Arundo donax TaxID=35708 RepID=A0A0A8ZXC4_ARUDO